jgi:hypothetical protein
MGTCVQLTSINPAGPVWTNLDTGYYMNTAATARKKESARGCAR